MHGPNSLLAHYYSRHLRPTKTNMVNHHTVVLYPAPSIGNFVSIVELGKLIAKHHPSFSVTVLVTTPPHPHNSGSTISSYINQVSKTIPYITFHYLPTISLSATTSSIFDLLHLNEPLVHQALKSISTTTTIISAFIVTTFSPSILREGNRSSRKWDVIFRISVGIARAMEYLHTGLQKPIIHGNLKSRNILLDGNYQPHVSDFSIHLLLNPATGQEMLEASASHGYKAPELIKLRDASKESDIYNLGIILLELITGKAPVNKKASPSHDLCLSDSVREAIIGHRISDLCHPDILLEQITHLNPVTEEHSSYVTPRFLKDRNPK